MNLKMLKRSSLALAKATEYIGKLMVARFPYYNNQEDRIKFKKRPILIIGVEKEQFPCDVTVLPVSKVSHKRHIHPEFDVEVSGNKCKQLKLHDSPSYIRTHKIATVHSSDIGHTIISDMRTIDKELFDHIKAFHHKFVKNTLFQ